jgi:hypothetical protein
MRTSRGFIRTSLLLAGLSLGVCSSAVASGTPAQVTVRVLGQAPGFTTLLPLTHVTTTSAPLVKDGGSCAGTSAAAALDLATGSAWEAHWNTSFGDYEVLSIEGLEYPFTGPRYWSFWLDGVESSTGICNTPLNPGDQLLFFPAFSCFGSGCPTPPNVLAVQAQEVAEVGSSVTFTVLSHPGTGGEATPASGATVSSSEASSQTDSSGRATLTFAHAGTYAIHVVGSGTGPESVPGEASVCVHNGNDGTCGTTAPHGSPNSSTSIATTQSTGVSSAPYRGPFALVARTTGPVDGHLYSRRGAPRILAGSVLSHSPVTSVALRLRRTSRGKRCSAYDGLRERFVAAHCGTGSFFAVSTNDAFSYLLPAPLAPGRYVLDIRASDAVGNQTVAARGTSRIVFYVR